MKKTIIGFFISLIFISGNAIAKGAMDEMNTQRNQQATISNTPGIHNDWYKINYDEIRDETVFEVKDQYGPGSSIAKVSNGNHDQIKVAISAILKGKVFKSVNSVEVTVSFNRMAGINMGDRGSFQSQTGNNGFSALGNGDALGGAKQLIALEKCKDVIFMFRSGKKYQVPEKSINYTTSISSGLMGEQYLWEVLSVTSDGKLLDNIQEVAKGDLGRIGFEFSPDVMAQAKTLLSLLNKTRDTLDSAE